MYYWMEEHRNHVSVIQSSHYQDHQRSHGDVVAIFYFPHIYTQKTKKKILKQAEKYLKFLRELEVIGMTFR